MLAAGENDLSTKQQAFLAYLTCSVVEMSFGFLLLPALADKRLKTPLAYFKYGE